MAVYFYRLAKNNRCLKYCMFLQDDLCIKYVQEAKHNCDEIMKQTLNISNCYEHYVTSLLFNVSLVYMHIYFNIYFTVYTSASSTNSSQSPS